MTEFARVIAPNGLRLRDSPRDGATLKVLPNDDRVEVLGRETWLRVRHGAQIGFVLADHVEPTSATVTLQSTPSLTAERYTGAVKIIEYSASTVFRGEALRIDEEFLPDLRKIEAAAKVSELTVWITSSMREPKKPVANAVVKPASFSNHHVGHAIDMNLILRGRFFRSMDLANPAALPPEITDFLRAIREPPDSLRWGNDFASPDPVHIDNGLNVFQQTIFREKLRRLWG
jgi:hypothetical protein